MMKIVLYTINGKTLTEKIIRADGATIGRGLNSSIRIQEDEYVS